MGLVSVPWYPHGCFTRHIPGSKFLKHVSFNTHVGRPHPAYRVICKSAATSREELKFRKYDRVRVIRNVTGKAGRRWQLLRRNFFWGDGDNSFQLFEGDIGTVNSVSSYIGPLGVSVILDRDVEKEVWVDPDDLDKDDLPLPEVDIDALSDYILKNFPR